MVGISEGNVYSGETLKQYTDDITKLKESDRKYYETISTITARAREGITNLFKGETTVEDFNTIKTLKESYESRLQSLHDNLGKEIKGILGLGKLDLTNLDDIETSRKDAISYTPGKLPSKKTEIQKIFNDTVQILKKLELKEDGEATDVNWNNIDGSQDNLGDNATTYNGKYDTLYNETTDTKVGKDINEILNIKNKKNILCPVNSSKLEENEKEIAIKVGLYLGLIKKYLLGEIDLTTGLKLKNLAEACQKTAYALRAIHNIRIQLALLNSEYFYLEKIKKLGTNLSQGEIDLASEQTKEITYKKDFEENDNDLSFSNFSLDPTKISITSHGNSVGTVKIDGNTNIIKGKSTSTSTKEKKLTLEVGGKEIEIGSITFDNGKFIVKFLKQEDINKNASNAKKHLASGPWNFSFPLTGSTTVYQLTSKGTPSSRRIGSTSHTKTIEGTLDIEINNPSTISSIIGRTQTSISAVLVDTGDIVKENASIDASEKNHKKYEKTQEGNILKRLGKKRRYNVSEGRQAINYEKEYLKEHHKLDLFKQENVNIANRSQYEEGLKELDTIKDNSNLNKMALDFFQETNPNVAEFKFTKEFKEFIEKEQIAGLNKKENLGTNILLQLKKKKGYSQLLGEIDTILNDTSKKDDDIKKTITSYITKHKDAVPELQKFFSEYVDKKIKKDDFQNYINNEQALLNGQIKNINIELKVKKAKSSKHSTDEREKKWYYKRGKKINNSRILKILSNKTGIGQRFTTYSKYTDEQKQYEYNLVNHFDEVTKNNEKFKKFIEDYKNGNIESDGIKETIANWIAYRNAKSQIAKYEASTNTLAEAKPLTTNINNELEKYLKDPSEPNRTALTEKMIEGYVRIKLHKDTGHNFLYSKRGNIEQDTEELLTAIIRSMQTLLHQENITEKDITDRFSTASSDLEKEKTFTYQYDQLKKTFEESQKHFKKQRRRRAWKHGLLYQIPRYLGRGGVLNHRLCGSDTIAEAVSDADIPTEGIPVGADTTDTIPTTPDTDTLPSQGQPPIPNQPPTTSPDSGGSNPENTPFEQEGRRTDNFNIGKHDLVDQYSDIQTGVQNFFGNIHEDLNGSTLEIKIGAGTDGLTYLPGHEPSHAIFETKINDITNYINNCTGLSPDQKKVFINYLSNLQDIDARNFNSDSLRAMRKAENVEHIVKSLHQQNISNTSMEITIADDSSLDLEGTTGGHGGNLNERFTTTQMKLTKPIEQSQGGGLPVDQGGQGGDSPVEGGGQSGGDSPTNPGGEQGGGTTPPTQNIEPDPNHPGKWRKVLGWTAFGATQTGPFKNTIYKNADSTLPQAE